jgi:hypothetical protein
MPGASVHQCPCADCQTAGHPHQEVHRLMNLLLSRRDEDHRRWRVRSRHSGEIRLLSGRMEEKWPVGWPVRPRVDEADIPCRPPPKRR